MKLNNIIAPDDKIIYVEPEMEVVLFDKSDLVTTFDSMNGFAGEEDGFDISNGFEGEDQPLG